MVQKINFQGRAIHLLTVQGLVCYYVSLTEKEKRRITLAFSEVFREKGEKMMIN